MNVLVGIDGSEQQRDAIALGEQLARVEGGRMTIAYAYPWSPSSVHLGSAYSKTIRDDAEELLSKASRLATRVPSRARAVADPSPPRALHRLAEAERPDIVVVGSSHRGPFGRALLGSVGDRVIHGAPCPVAVAPRGFAEAATETRQLGVAYDGSPEARDALAWTSRFAQAAGAAVTVFTVFEPAAPPPGSTGAPPDSSQLEETLRRAWQQQLDEAVATMPAHVEATGVMLNGAPAPALATAASDVDLVVVGSRGYGPIRTTLLGSVSRSLVHHSPRPVIVVPRGAAATSDDAYGEASALGAHD